MVSMNFTRTREKRTKKIKVIDNKPSQCRCSKPPHEKRRPREDPHVMMEEDFWSSGDTTCVIERSRHLPHIGSFALHTSITFYFK